MDPRVESHFVIHNFDLFCDLGQYEPEFYPIENFILNFFLSLDIHSMHCFYWIFLEHGVVFLKHRLVTMNYYLKHLTS